MEQHRATRSDNDFFSECRCGGSQHIGCVIGGLIEKVLEETETMAEKNGDSLPTCKDVEMIDNTAPIALATFEPPMQALKFIQSQKRNAVMQTIKCQASKHRSKKKNKKASMQSAEQAK